MLFRSGAGTIRSCKVSARGKTVDLCLTRTMATYERVEGGVKLTTDPVSLDLCGLEVVIQSSFIIMEGDGKIITERKILNDLGGEEVTFTEYFTGGFGTTEYQADMTNIVLGVDRESMPFSYHGKKIVKENAQRAYVVIPEVSTEVSMGGEGVVGVAEEGIAFSPVYHIEVSKTVSEGGVKTWLSLQKAN